MSDELSKLPKEKAETPPTPSTSAVGDASQETVEPRENVSPPAEDGGTSGASGGTSGASVGTSGGGGTSDPIEMRHAPTQYDRNIRSWMEDCTRRGAYSFMTPFDDHFSAPGATGRGSPWAEHPGRSGRRKSEDSPSDAWTSIKQQRESSAGPSSRDESTQSAPAPPDQDARFSDLMDFIRNLDSCPDLRNQPPIRPEPAGDDLAGDVDNTLAKLEEILPDLDEFVNAMPEKGPPGPSQK